MTNTAYGAKKHAGDFFHLLRDKTRFAGNGVHLLRNSAANTQETELISQETASISQEMKSNSCEIKKYNGFLKKISRKMKTVSWEIKKISCMFFSEIDMETGIFYTLND
jgi:hypothetical protein